MITSRCCNVSERQREAEGKKELFVRRLASSTFRLSDFAGHRRHWTDSMYVIQLCGKRNKQRGRFSRGNRLGMEKSFFAPLTQARQGTIVAMVGRRGATPFEAPKYHSMVGL